MGLVVGAGASGLLAGCSPKEGREEEPVRVTEFIWVGGGQGVVPREVKAEYEAEHPWVTIDLYEGTNATTYPKMVAQKEVDPNDPLVNFGFFNVDATTKGTLDDMWLSMDPEKIPNLNEIYEQYVQPERKGVAFAVSAIGFIYNTELVDEPPKVWNDMFDPRFKGKVAVWDYAWSFNGLVPVAYANGGDEENMEPAWERYSQAAKDGQFRFVFDSNQQLKDAMTRGEVLVAPFFMPFAITWGPKGDGAPIAYAIPEDGPFAFPILYQIVKGSSERQIDVASDIINMYLSPEWQGRYCSIAGRMPTGKRVRLDAEMAKEPLFAPEIVEKTKNLDWLAIAKHNQEWKERWDREVKAYL